MPERLSSYRGKGGGAYGDNFVTRPLLLQDHQTWQTRRHGKHLLPLLVPSHWGRGMFNRREWGRRPSARTCCVCPVATRPRRQCSARSHSQGGEVRRVRATADVGNVPQAKGGSG